MSWVLNIGYIAAALACLPWMWFQRVAKGKRRAGWREKLTGCVPRRQGDQDCVWFHAVSVGEVNALVPIIDETRRRWPQLECVITTTTATGFEVAQRRFPELLVSYAPLDFSWAVRRAIHRWNPSLIVLAELELWPNWLREARRAGVPVAVVNGRLSDKSFRGYRRFRSLLRPMFASLSAVAAQSEQYAERFRELGTPPDRVVCCGSVKFDGALSDRQLVPIETLRQWARIKPGEVVFLAGSTQHPEESLALETYRLLQHEFPQLRLALCPRHPERFGEVAELIAAHGIPWARRSTDSHGDQPIILIDTMGELSYWWGCAQIAYVGGSMGSREGQNMIEPAAFGAAVCFGPRTRNFRDVVALLLGNGGARVVRDQGELTEFVRRCLADPQWRTEIGGIAKQTVESQLGAVAKSVDVVESVRQTRRTVSRAA